MSEIRTGEKEIISKKKVINKQLTAAVTAPGLRKTAAHPSQQSSPALKAISSTSSVDYSFLKSSQLLTASLISDQG